MLEEVHIKYEWELTGPWWTGDCTDHQTNQSAAVEVRCGLTLLNEPRLTNRVFHLSFTFYVILVSISTEWRIGKDSIDEEMVDDPIRVYPFTQMGIPILPKTGRPGFSTSPE